MKDMELISLAEKARENAYAPYSGFKVGAAIETEKGRIFTGVNIENASYGATNCAERTAIFKAVSEGEKEIKTIAIAGDSDEYIYPCGICRQVISEFANKDTRILCSSKNGGYKEFTVEELLPNAFNKNFLEKTGGEKNVF